ncbi:type II toxin-antitoxin system HicA family toxin [Runella aurantiaca]|uniref:Type II toxin-antitoxin system HicA family toxin n=1 Tax=Runella aurantiaca TaxID=2282308 RepID=A0A369IC27_9BACT|nr:type II toxin-antitoxin system HicA family toxin [Runella aurantiaca]RDB05053.1 type II toxin-antitoxin system HicA family toxin [Runella aurantiaca]
MKIPRDITGVELVRLLKKLDYEVVRQTDSHIRIRTEVKGQHQETIPNHIPIKIGTLNAILNNISSHFGLTKEQLIAILFG